jgi:hypothetical protein
MTRKSTHPAEIQSVFLNGIKDIIPSHTSLVNELSDILEISMDSAYRRIRGETLLTIDEVSKLCAHYNISFDALANLKAGMVSFSYLPLEPLAANFALYHQNLRNEISKIAAAKESNIIYACQDLPLFHHYRHPDLANFKVFYWKRSIMNIPEMANQKFGSHTIFADLIETGQAIVKAYAKVPSVEIWTDNTIQSTIKQIRFYWDSGVFETKEDAIRVCAALKNEMEGIQLNAEYGSKLINKQMNETGENHSEDEKVIEPGTNFQLYVSEIEVTNNCVLVNIENLQSVYLGHFSFSTMSTRNEVYCKKTESWLNNLMRKSTLISGVAEKQRYQFFKNIYEKIESVVNEIEKE